MNPASPGGAYNVSDVELILLAEFLEENADIIVQRSERSWDSSILLFAQVTGEQRKQIRQLAKETVAVWAMRLRQLPDYSREVLELGQKWGAQALEWQLHVYSFSRALDLLLHAAWEDVTEYFPMAKLSPSSVFFLGRSRDQILDDLRVPLLSTFLQQREVEMEKTLFTLSSKLSLPGRSLLYELGNRLQANKDRVIPGWIESVKESHETTPAMMKLLEERAAVLVNLLLSLLQSPTPETGEASLANVRAIGLESAQAGVSFQEMFHALQQVRPILWDTVYEIYRREQYWHPAEFIEVLARLHLLLDLFSEGIGQAYLQQKEMIIQQQAEKIHRRDLNLAREILESLLPNRQFTVPNTDVGSLWIPSREIGGDFYDIFTIGEEDIMFVIGDVSGKGVSAALLVSMVKYVLKANAPLQTSPGELLMVANKILYQDMGPEMFVTMFVARYTPSTGRLIYTSAGHDPCYICRCEKPYQIVELSNKGPLLGVFEEVTLEDAEEVLKPGDMLLLYTDGLVNVRCKGVYPVHSRGLCGYLRKNCHLSSQELTQGLLENSTAGCELTDDITLLIAKRDLEGPLNG